MTSTLVMWTIYERPRDRRGPFTVRTQTIEPGVVIHGDAKDAPNLTAARALVPPGLTCVPRRDEDDPCIVEVWM